MPTAVLQPTSIAFLVIDVVIVSAAIALAQGHLRHVTRLSSGQTSEIVRKLKRLPAEERLPELQRHSLPGSIERHIAEEAMLVDEGQRAFAIDSILGDIALELERRASWPRAAIRISAASGVLLMALAISLRLEVFISITLVVLGACGALVCITLDRRSSSMASEVRRQIDALIDALALRNTSGGQLPISRAERRSRRRRASS